MVWRQATDLARGTHADLHPINVKVDSVAEIIRVLIIDDSAFVRKVIRQILSRSPFIEVVGTARDGADGLDLVEQLKPDVVTLDLNMPRGDGLTFLKTQMAKAPLPIIVVSTASKDGQQVLDALDAGAVDVVQKPTGLATDQLREISEDLVAKVKVAATAHFAQRESTTADVAWERTPLSNVKADIVVIGVSTGGPQALKYLIAHLPTTMPVPVAIVLHMPFGYTELFARSLNEVSELRVSEAQEGQLVTPGEVLLAPAGFHLTFVRQSSSTVVTHLDLNPLDTPHRPAVDVLFRSAAEVYGERTLAVVMTGMGSDGTKGAAWVKARGGRVFAEAEESCVVYGMPRSIVEAGLCDKSVPLGRMARSIVEAL